MKVLFVCRGNVGRSQMAEAFYNSFTKSHNADSAGTVVDVPGQTLAERKELRPGASFVVDVMNEEGLDVANAKRIQLTKDMLDKYDLIVSMAGKRYTPKWLADSPKYIFWKVRDPMGRNYQVTSAARDKIKEKVLELIKEYK